MAQQEKCTKTDAWHHTRLILHQIQIHLYSPHRSLIVTSNVILNPKSLLRNPPKNLSWSQNSWSIFPDLWSHFNHLNCHRKDDIVYRWTISPTVYIYIYCKKKNIYIYVIFIYQYILYTYWQNIIIGPSFLCGVRLSALSQVCHTDCKKIDELFHRPGHGKRWIKHFGKNWFYWGLVPKKSASPCSMRGYLLREITRDMRFFPSMGYPAGGSKREGPWLQLCAVWSKHSYWDCHSLLASPLKLTWLGR